MPEPLRPDSTKTFGRSNWVLIKTIASATKAPTVAEWTAATSLDITRIAFASTGRPTQTTNRVNAERRLGDTKQYEFIGVSQQTGGDMLYQFAAQAAAGADGKKLYAAIPEGSTYFLAERKGLGRAVDAVAGQWANVYPVEFGPSFPVDQGDAEAAESAMTATFAITSDPAINVQILA